MSIAERVKEFRFAPVDRKSQRAGDKFLGFWIYVKTFGMQGVKRSQVRQCANYLHKFFETGELSEIISEGDEAWEVIAEHCLLSAKLFIETCLSDRNYGSKLFNLVPLKQEELELKIADDRDRIVEIIEATEFSHKQLLIDSYRQAYNAVMQAD